MKRLDVALVEGCLCASREKARRAIMAGLVTVNGQPARKPGHSVKESDRLSVAAGEKYVSRGGQKLEHALDHFGLDVCQQTAIDLGASTGGFTDCLLQRGAARVFAVDVGRGQLAWKLRNDARVVVMEQTNARDLTAARFPKPFAPADLVVIDCSFISLRKILPPAVALLRPLGNIVALIKPQFEAGKAEADKGAGVITDPAIHERVLREIEEFVGSLPVLRSSGTPTATPGSQLTAAAEGGPRSEEKVSRGERERGSGEEFPPAPFPPFQHALPEPALRWRGVTESPLLGPAGNKEFLALIEKAG